MSFQAYLDKVEEKTGKTPKQFIAIAKRKKLTEHKEILEWLKEDYGLGTGHARAIAHVILKGPEFELRHTTGTHRDESGTLKLDGKKARKKWGLWVVEERHHGTGSNDHQPARSPHGP